MGKALTRTEINEKKIKRLNDKSLRQMLIHRFLNSYGYDKGEVTARAIVDDIVNLIEDYFLIRLPLDKLASGEELPDERLLSGGQLVWLAVPVDEYPQRGKAIADTRMKPVILTFISSEDIERFYTDFSSRDLRIHRLVRWCHQAYDQGALLTQLDIAVLLNVREPVVSEYVNEWQAISGKVLPTRGNIHDLSAAITHKKEIIALYLQGHLTPTIASKTKHSKESVDRYIHDYESVKTVRAATDDIDKISQITKLSKRVVSQYLDLIPQRLLDDMNVNRTTPSETGKDTTILSSS